MSPRLEASKLKRATTVPDLRTVEGRVARRYWEAFGKVMPEHLDFHGRMTPSHQNNASNPVNLALNYAYGVLEGECRRAINAVGLESSVGFLHDFSNYQTKQSLVYDLQEPFRWLSDISVIEAFESEALKLSDFYFTGDDYRYRFEPDARQRFIEVLRQQFNSGVTYKSKVLKWDTIIEQKTTELDRYLVGKSRKLNLIEPAPILARNDSQVIRNKILQITQTQAEKIGITRSTLHYLRKNAANDRAFRTYNKVNEKLEHAYT